MITVITYEDDWAAAYNSFGELMEEGHTSYVLRQIVQLVADVREATREEEAIIYNEGSAPQVLA